MYRTPAHTTIKAKNVPTLVRSTKNCISMNIEGMATTNPVIIVANEGVLNFG
jgi:hypothetical protein